MAPVGLTPNLRVDAGWTYPTGGGGTIGATMTPIEFAAWLERLLARGGDQIRLELRCARAA